MDYVDTITEYISEDDEEFIWRYRTALAEALEKGTDIDMVANRKNFEDIFRRFVESVSRLWKFDIEPDTKTGFMVLVDMEKCPDNYFDALVQNKLPFKYLRISDDVGLFKRTAEIIEQNNIITTLDFSVSCMLFSKDAVVIAAALVKNKTLTHLDISNQEIDDDGGQALADAIFENVSLQYVDLSQNNFSEEVKELLEDVCRGKGIECEV